MATFSPVLKFPLETVSPLALATPTIPTKPCEFLSCPKNVWPIKEGICEGSEIRALIEPSKIAPVALTLEVAAFIGFCLTKPNSLIIPRKPLESPSTTLVAGVMAMFITCPSLLISNVISRSAEARSISADSFQASS